jgi:hypothetical protein
MRGMYLDSCNWIGRRVPDISIYEHDGAPDPLTTMTADFFADSHLLHEVSGLVVANALPRGCFDSLKVVHAELDIP